MRPARALLGLVAAVLVGLVVPAAASTLVTLQVSGSLHAVTDPVTDTALCQQQGGEYVPGPTDYSYSGTSSYAGTFQGTGRFCGRSTGAVNPDGTVPFIETDTFTGTVRGCGSGTVTYHVHGVIDAALDLATKGVPAEEDWVVVVRSATGGLRALRSGHGHDHATINPDSSIDAEFSGVVTCLTSPPRPAPRYGARPVHAFNNDNEGLGPDGLSCSAGAGGCSARMTGSTVWTGDFAGPGSYALDFTPAADGTVAYQGIERLSVAVPGCGRGTFEVRISDGSYDPKLFLSSGGSPVVNHDRWAVVAGSGTGALIRASGHGTELVTDYGNGKTRSELRGVFSC
jgi:hypothetical protein